MKRRVYIFGTFACTLNCPRCYQRELDVPRHYRMAMNTCRRIFKRLGEQKYEADEIVFTGGEPTCWVDLKEAIETVHAWQPKARVRVVTNGFGRTMADYGSADVIQVSDYGAINRMDQYRLKKQGGSRVRIQTSVHWQWDRSIESELPGVCGCNGLAFVADRVWPCAMTAAAQTSDGMNIEQDFVEDFSRPEAAHYQDFCTSCLVNRKNRKAPRPVVQLSVWEGKSWLCG